MLMFFRKCEYLYSIIAFWNCPAQLTERDIFNVCWSLVHFYSQFYYLKV